MAQDMSTQSGGVHPGKPIIWPSGKSAPQAQTVNQTQISGNVKGSVSTGSTTGAAPTTTVSQTTGTTTALPPTQAANIARPLTIADIKQHLLQLQIPDTDFNVKLASLMLKDGLELSQVNFVSILSLLQGTNKSLSMQEAAIMLTMKGIDSPEALQILGKFFAENPQIASQLVALQQGLTNLGSALGISKGLLDTNLVSQLGALLAQFDEAVSGFTGKQFKVNNKNLLNDIKALKALLTEVQGKAENSGSAEAQVLQSSLGQSMSKLNAVIENLVAQALLSQKGKEDVNFLYKQVPNLSADPPKDLEIVIKRNGDEKNSTFDYENSQVVLSLQTANLGKMVCSVYVKAKRVYIVFVFNKKEYGDDASEIIAREYSELQKKLVQSDFIVSGYQIKIDPAMCSVKPYLIPMLPKLGAQLKRIDLEA
ncbi:hypothetical protein A2230_01730 [candidate division WOR-1 bacterium RIFOXYA2_FULL_36_21]|uniref:Flagellar hook-length control protein-like C-terminal domain-containing protein n=1 Tax=candidate division WOR-1 bacterium RIFOXYB2_FULL_36_35 TaxID=1802578 RepID=A0A1F4S7D9_UNCSA|nr:MAG: hypothetical protein A2230_01730 [candidate division WOR-1 bacterium RIFOXYA2_FULL_36_21]OGC15672.1 MAG: hypothetical protein A2282_04315 [candidate division WOR-1 bacterium RIFOXYA12_FULL_36_13]OGC16330.1 MAG: hypothetical protein A2290_04455 [candidate division WOR-1 bacterium RIFOXYB2_FULL_36_35]